MKCFLTHQRQQTTKQTNLSGFLLRYKSPQVVKQISSPIQTMVWECQKQCHDTTLRSQNAEQLRENGWLRCRCKPQSFKTYDSSELGVWSSDKGSVQTAKLTKNYDQKTIEESHHYVVRTYSIVSSHVHMDCQTSASAGESFIHLASHNLHRACIYCNLDPAWVQLGSSWDPASIQLGSSLDPAWT